ncbi:MGMT family protein [Deferribacter thermophilus]|uniref:methylated-DNA--[protein]-cysteine S-methyltransferase n=1 Tax=Deferribacter thermophilus TaxID=53573 RepID=UPI003C277820
MSIIRITDFFSAEVSFDKMVGKIKKVKILFGDYDNYETEKLPADIVRYFKKYPFENIDVFCLVVTEKINSTFLKIYKNLLDVSYGKTITYGELAEKSGIKNGARVVGSAMAKNNYPLIIPCHRVVAKNGLGGFYYGLDNKHKLIEWEKSL